VIFSETRLKGAFILELEDFEGPRYRRIDQIKLLMGSGSLGRDLRWNAEIAAA